MMHLVWYDVLVKLFILMMSVFTTIRKLDLDLFTC